MARADAADRASAGHASPNFGHLAKRVPLLASLGVKAERFVFEEPDTALFKLRQFGEVLAQEAAASVGLYTVPGEPQVDLLRRLRDGGIIDRELSDLFHTLRKSGNRAVHAKPAR
jgi:type I restriction enzyme R subunit